MVMVDHFPIIRYSHRCPEHPWTSVSIVWVKWFPVFATYNPVATEIFGNPRCNCRIEPRDLTRIHGELSDRERIWVGRGNAHCT